jgi:hypothetical protein
MPEVKALFYIPLRDSDGRELSDEIEELLAEYTSGSRGGRFKGSRTPKLVASSYADRGGGHGTRSVPATLAPGSSCTRTQTIP